MLATIKTEVKNVEIERENFKSILLEVMLENPAFFKAIFKEILEEKMASTSSSTFNRQEWIDKLIDEDFEKYDEVFKALA